MCLWRSGLAYIAGTTILLYTIKSVLEFFQLYILTVTSLKVTITSTFLFVMNTSFLLSSLEKQQTCSAFILLLGEILPILTHAVSTGNAHTVK